MDGFIQMKDEKKLRDMLKSVREQEAWCAERIEYYWEEKSIRGLLQEIDDKFWDIISLLEERL